jgi:hypothetical protein
MIAVRNLRKEQAVGILGDRRKIPHYPIYEF